MREIADLAREHIMPSPTMLTSSAAALIAAASFAVAGEIEDLSRAEDRQCRQDTNLSMGCSGGGVERQENTECDEKDEKAAGELHS